jgi:hypothetical protein
VIIAIPRAHAGKVSGALHPWNTHCVQRILFKILLSSGVLRMITPSEVLPHRSPCDWQVRDMFNYLYIKHTNPIDSPAPSPPLNGHFIQISSPSDEPSKPLSSTESTHIIGLYPVSWNPPHQFQDDPTVSTPSTPSTSLKGLSIREL